MAGRPWYNYNLSFRLRERDPHHPTRKWKWGRPMVFSRQAHNREEIVAMLKRKYPNAGKVVIVSRSGVERR